MQASTVSSERLVESTLLFFRGSLLKTVPRFLAIPHSCTSLATARSRIPRPKGLNIVIALGVGLASILPHKISPIEPRIKCRCDVYHPFQALADLMTIMESKGRNLSKKKMVISWAYASSYLKPLSVPQSLILQMPRFGIDIALAHPPEFSLMPAILATAYEQSRKYSTKLEIFNNMQEAIHDADIVYAKSWSPMLTTTEVQEGRQIQDQYQTWIMNEEKMATAKEDAIYLHPLPADRNIEVTDAIIDGPQSVVFEEAENRLHVQKAVMALTMD